MLKIAVASASVFILSTNNFHDDFLIEPERRWLKTPKDHELKCPRKNTWPKSKTPVMMKG
jgi:hypothetical protein